MSVSLTHDSQLANSYHELLEYVSSHKYQHGGFTDIWAESSRQRTYGL